MSKYRVLIAPSLHYRIFQLLSGSVLLFSIWCWKVDLFAAQWLVQLLLSVLVVFFITFQIRSPSLQTTVSVDENGEWIWLQQQTMCTITSASRVSSWLLWVCLSSPMGGKLQWLWVFRDAVSDDDYRRLARIIIRIQQKGDR